MRSPWGELSVGDAHVHFFSHRFFELLHAGMTVDQTTGILDWRAPPERPEDLAAEWVAEMDQRGVAKASLIASLPGDESSVARAVARFPSRFHGYFMLNPLAADAPAAAATALDAGMRAMCLFPAMHRYSLHDERVTAVLEVARGKPGTAIFVHCGMLTVGVRKKLGLPSLFDMRYSNPIDVHALAMRYSGIKFVLPHFGAGYFREALMLCDLCPNVYLDTSSTNSWMSRQPESLDLKAVFRRALDAAGSKRLLFGSDSSFFPRGWNAAIFEAQAAALAEIGISAGDAKRIFGENLEEFTC